VDKFSTIHSKKVSLSPAVVALFKHYSWPGNIRELEHIIEYATIRCTDSLITPAQLPPDILEQASEPLELNSAPLATAPSSFLETDLASDVVQKNLIAYGWNKSKTSKSLGIGRTTLWRLMKKYHITDPSS